MAGPDNVSTSIFGISVPSSTGAPGGGDISQTQPGTASTGAPNSSGGQVQPQDLVTPTPHSHVENSYHEVDQSGFAHGGVEASQVRPAFGSNGMQTDTGAGHGSVGHNATGVN